MIPQRNISLLANRLYKEHGGRRIPEAVLERDYCLAWFLVGLSQSKLRDLLIFKGGTALKRCHFGDYRFSEDLDFTLARRVEFAEILAGLEEVYELVAQASGIRFSFEAEDRQTHVNSYTFYLRYQGPLPTPNTVKVDITVAEILIFPVEQLPVPDGTYARIAGAVIARQRPGTAEGFIFLSLEDETGISNAIINPQLYERNRITVTRGKFLRVDGTLQNQDGVINVRASAVHVLSLSNVAMRSHDFH